MTEMPIEHAAHAAVHPHARGPADLLRDALPVLHLLTARPRLTDAVVHVNAAGVPDAEVEGLIAGLHGLAARAEGLNRHGTGPQPAFLPAPPADGSEGM